MDMDYLGLLQERMSSASAPAGSSRVTPSKLRNQVIWRLASWRVAATAFSRIVAASVSPYSISHTWR